MDEKAIVASVEKGIKGAFGELKVDSRTHFRHHEVIGRWLRFTEGVSKTFWTGLVLGFLGFLFVIVRLGFEAYLKVKGGGVG